MAFDTVISIGGQSLLDGVWRVLQPALQSLSNPLPVSIPGMTNAWVRIRKITPSLSNTEPPRLVLVVDVESRGDVLLTATLRAGVLNLTLPNLNIMRPLDVPKFRLPQTDITLPSVSGSLPLTAGGTLTLIPTNTPPTPPGTGSIRLPNDDVNITLPEIIGTIHLPTEPINLGLPLPSVVPVSLNLTPTNPAQILVALDLSAHTPIDGASAFGLQLELGLPNVRLPVSLGSELVASLESAIINGFNQLISQLGVPLPAPIFPPPGTPISPVTEPFEGVGPNLAEIRAIASNIAAAARVAIQKVVGNALTGLTARTGRLIFPPSAPGAPCDVALLPTEAHARVFISTADSSTGTVSSPVLQVYFVRTGITAPPFNPASDFYNFGPVIAPGRPREPIKDVEVKIGNSFLRDLLCCLVEKLPNFKFHEPATNTPRCCDWSGVTLNLWPLALTGTLSLCIVGPSNATKRIELVGNFIQNTALIDISVRFTLGLNPHLNDVCAVTGVPFATTTPEVSFKLNSLVVASLVAAAVFLALLVPVPGFNFLVPALGVLLGLIPLLISFVERQLRAVADTVFNAVRALTSPVAIPSGFFEAFGRMVPVSVVVDDLTAQGVLATPTSAWALTPINATLPDPLQSPAPEDGRLPQVGTHLSTPNKTVASAAKEAE
jgi:hypothetical protein